MLHAFHARLARVIRRLGEPWELVLARAYRWRRMLERGRYATIDELAAAEKINKSYVSRVLRLTLLAPEIVEAILDGRQAEGMTLPMLMGRLPAEWERQRLDK